MAQEQTLPIPEVLRQLIQHQNDVLTRTQQELFNKLANANAELMNIMGLLPDEGWQLDIDRMVYVRTIPDEETPPSNKA